MSGFKEDCLETPHLEKEAAEDREEQEVLSPRESIRRQLASEASVNSEDPQLTSHNLLLCFLNETPSDLEEESEETEIAESKIPPNHPLAACLNKASSDWQSQDSSSDEEAEENISESINTSRVFVEGNISRKKGHVIIPLRCSSEAAIQPPSPKVRSPSSNNGDLEADGFFQQLAIIQAETRRQLREAKSLAIKTVQAEKCERQIRDDIAKLLVHSPESKRFLDQDKKYPVTSSLNRRILTPMNVSQLQVILNYLLTQIETLNENLVQYLITRDELAIEQDSLLTDVEDITKCIQGHDMSPF